MTATSRSASASIRPPRLRALEDRAQPRAARRDDAGAVARGGIRSGRRLQHRADQREPPGQADAAPEVLELGDEIGERIRRRRGRRRLGGRIRRHGRLGERGLRRPAAVDRRPRRAGLLGDGRERQRRVAALGRADGARPRARPRRSPRCAVARAWSSALSITLTYRISDERGRSDERDDLRAHGRRRGAAAADAHLLRQGAGRPRAGAALRRDAGRPPRPRRAVAGRGLRRPAAVQRGARRLPAWCSRTSTATSPRRSARAGSSCSTPRSTRPGMPADERFRRTFRLHRVGHAHRAAQLRRSASRRRARRTCRRGRGRPSPRDPPQ